MRAASSDNEHDERSVHGLNLTVPEDAQALIKPWDERDDTSRYAESGVDDQVRSTPLTTVDVERIQIST